MPGAFKGLKLKQYAEQFPDFKQSSDPSLVLVILCMERHGSWSKGTRQYWEERVQAAHQRQAATMYFQFHTLPPAPGLGAPCAVFLAKCA